MRPMLYSASMRVARTAVAPGRGRRPIVPDGTISAVPQRQQERRFCMLVRMRARVSRRCLLAAVAAGVGGSLRAEASRPVVVFQTSKGVIEIELYPEIAPRTVENFLTYVNAGFYDGTVFHRVIEKFVVQGGGFTPELMPKPTLKPVRIETKNGIRNERGTVAMARQAGKNTATSQFFFNLQNNANLDRGAMRFGYTVFARVVEGMEVVDRISLVQTGLRGPMRDVPILPVFLESARVASGSGAEDASEPPTARR